MFNNKLFLKQRACKYVYKRTTLNTCKKHISIKQLIAIIPDIFPGFYASAEKGNTHTTLNPSVNEISSYYLKTALNTWTSVGGQTTVHKPAKYPPPPDVGSLH